MRKSRIEICIILVALLLCAIPAFGQLTAGSVAGSVFDSSGAAMANATIVLKAVDTGATLTTTSNDAGNFIFPVVPSGEYTFTADAKGFKTSVGNLQVQLNVRASLKITMQLGEVSQKVEVTDAVANVETTSTQITATFSQDAGAESSHRVGGRESSRVAEPRGHGHQYRRTHARTIFAASEHCCSRLGGRDRRGSCSQQ